MATVKAYTDLSQSKTLSKILPLETADMYWDFGNIKFMDNDYDSNVVQNIPAWSLAALRNLLPTAIKPNKDTYLFESHNTFDNSWVYRYYNEDDTSYLYCKDTNEVDACFEMIIELHELKML